MVELLQRLGGSREACFLDGVSPRVDAAIACHEVRGAKTTPGERLYVSFRVAGRHDRESFADVGEQCRLRSLQHDSVVLVRVVASTKELSMVEYTEKRPCGEVRIPLRHLIQRCDGALYYTWILLGSLGLHDSVASVGLLSAGGCGDGEDFAQALLNGPRELAQPRICVSICNAEDLGPSGQMVWTSDASRKTRLMHWGPLLRSQQQHVLMSTMQHLHGSQAQKENLAPAAQDDAGLEERAGRQAKEIEALQAELRKRQSAEYESRRLREALRDTEERSEKQLREAHERAEAYESRAAAAMEKPQEVEKHRSVAARLKQELESLQDELIKIGDEANKKIVAANARIKTLRQERDAAVQQAERHAGENRQLLDSNGALTAEKVKLEEQKEALLKIVEDLHQSCISAGLPMAGRTSMNSIKSLRYP